ncbi:MAG: hypothetical protein IJI46_08060 [Erysipelotrichaceae bacterium]|nr:hypothetical protein [Erysipelotrichaceae bacterium]
MMIFAIILFLFFRSLSLGVWNYGRSYRRFYGMRPYHYGHQPYGFGPHMGPHHMGPQHMGGHPGRGPGGGHGRF